MRDHHPPTIRGGLTEAEWLRARSPQPLLAHLAGGISPRQLRLFAVACCRRIWPLVPPDGRRVVEAAERFAEGEITEVAFMHERWTLGYYSFVGYNSSAHMAVQYATRPSVDPRVTSEGALAAVRAAAGEYDGAEAERQAQADLFRCVFGNPFRPIEAAWHWFTPNVIDVARALYEDRAFERMPILADALMDEGCDSEEMLDHCRKPGEHTRGCWVLDLILNKA